MYLNFHHLMLAFVIEGNWMVASMLPMPDQQES
jgi:hypothetical protein